jgi:arginase
MSLQNTEVTVQSALIVFSAYHDMRLWMTLTLPNWCDWGANSDHQRIMPGRRDLLPVLYNAWGALRALRSLTAEPTVMRKIDQAPTPGAGSLHSGTQALPPRRIRVIGVPLDMGASRRGVDMGPSAMRVAGLEARLEALGHRVTDGGNIRVEVAETLTSGSDRARYLKPIAETCSRTADAVVKTLEEGMTPLLLGGDHSLAAGSISGVAEFYRRQGQKIGVLWIDAHSDINTPETSPSGNVHGMPLAALLGLGPEELGNLYGYAPKISPENTVLIGIRDIDAAERENIRRAGIAEVYTMRDIDERGMRAVMEEALRAAGRGTAGYHVSLDMDWIDPEDAPGVGTPVRGGATYREAHLAMEILADHGRLLSFEIVEVNPVIDEHNRTADLAVELACSAFGKKIL